VLSSFISLDLSFPKYKIGDNDSDLYCKNTLKDKKEGRKAKT